MYHENDIHQPSLGGLFKTILAFTFIAVYAVMSVNTGDLLWFWPKFESQPSSLLVHCYGEDVAITPASQHFAPLVEILNASLSGEKRWDPLSMSQATYDEYRTSPVMLTIEVYYPEPVRVHTQTAYFSNVDILVIPLDARHSNYNTIFGRSLAGDAAAGSLHVASIEALRVYLFSQGLCQQPDESLWGQQPGQDE